MWHPIYFAALVILSLTAEAQVYKWTDAEGKVHYGSQPPANGSSAQPLDIRSQPTPPGGVDNVHSLQRAREELRELRAAHRGIPVEALEDDSTSRKKSGKGGKSSKTGEPIYIGYEDQTRIDNLNSDIRRLSSSTIGASSNRAREIRAIKDELRQIYRKYGVKGP